MPLRDGFFSTATQTSCCNRIQRSNRVRLLVVSTHDFPDIEKLARVWLIELIRAQVLTATWVVGNISSVDRVGEGLICSVWERDIIYFISGSPLVGFFPCSVSHKLGICVA